MTQELVRILMERDGISKVTAEQMLEDARLCIQQGLANGMGVANAEKVLDWYLGLEPDYLPEFLV